MLDGAINGAWKFRSIARLIALIHKPAQAFLSWIGIEDIGRRDIRVQPRIVPIRRPGPERTPGGPTETPSPESPTPTAATPTPSPVPAGIAPSPAAVPTAAPSAPVVATPGKITGSQASTVEGRGCASNLSAWCGEGVPLSVGYSRVIRHGGRPCCDGGSAGPGRSTAHSFATYGPGAAGWKLMPSGRCVAGAAAFPRPRMSGTCAAWGTGTNARPHGRSPTGKAGSTAMIAAAITAAAGSAKGATASVSVETSTAASA